MGNNKGGKMNRLQSSFVMFLILVVALTSLLIACGQPSTPTATAPTSTITAPTTTRPPTSTGTSPSPTTTTTGGAKPQGELFVALSDLGNEQFLPWNANAGDYQIESLVYD